MQTSFVAIDVETANPDRSSICQIGIVRVQDGAIADTWTTLVDPEAYFDSWNIEIHGITPEMVRGQPKFPDLTAHLGTFVGTNVVASHTAFDRVAIGRAHERYGISPPAWSWLDTASVSRRAWKDFADAGYGLEAVAAHCGIHFRHHDAGEDAKAAALVLLRAIDDTKFDVMGWQARVRQPIDPNRGHISQQGAADGPLVGEVIVFTGALSIPRVDAASRAASLGCDVRESVTAKTTMLVVGQQDLTKLGGYTKSSKQRKAEDLILHGAAIAILSEADFMHLADNSMDVA
jgi:DNA polymerase-3 subunit epsilon